MYRLFAVEYVTDKRVLLGEYESLFEVCEVNSYLQTLLNSAYTFYEECDGEGQKESCWLQARQQSK